MSQFGADLNDPEKTIWDVIVVGTGMGGGTIGYALAKAGRKVLFLERGRSTLPPGNGITRGPVPEDLGAETLRANDANSQSLLIQTGRTCDEVEDVSHADVKTFVPFMGSGTGGSSQLYGMALERFFPSDFTPRQNFPDAGASTVPEVWPINYDDLLPWYVEAEKLFQVSGSPDPLRPGEDWSHLQTPPPFFGSDAELYHDLIVRDIHPYRLHMACEHRPECSTCPGHLCPQYCRRDASNMCVLPAISQHGATLLAECRVEELEADATSVRSVQAFWQDRMIRLKGKIVVLGAGGLVSPTILLKSSSPYWPTGLGNLNDQVGRNFMKHGLGVYIVPMSTPRPPGEKLKNFGFNDFYHVDGMKLGTVQVGQLPPLGLTLAADHPALRFLRRIRKFIEPRWNRRSAQLLGFGTILEDLPYRDNRVLPPTTSNAQRQHFRLTYRPGESERRRAAEFKRRLDEIFRPKRPFHVAASDDNRMITHICGTCRFGDDPKTNVLDRNNRIHGIANTFVVDASFFPSSAGINPSLTIAANALRVAAHIDSNFDELKGQA